MNPVPARRVDEPKMVSRNVLCTSYAECLNLTLSRGWQSFSCGCCASFSPAQRSPFDWGEDARGCAELISVIFGLTIMPAGMPKEL